MQGRLTLRERLVVLVAAALLPVAGLSLWVALRESEAATGLARDQLRLSASLLAASEDRLITGTEQLLRTIAAVPQLHAGPGCQAFFEQLRERYGAYTNIGLIGPDGRLACHALGGAGSVSVVDRDYYRRALASHDFTMGAPTVGRVSGLRGLPFALPLVQGGRVTGMLFALAKVEQAAAPLRGVQLPPQAQVAVSDRAGHLLLAWPLPSSGALPERITPALPPPDGSLEVLEPDGERRLFAFAETRRVGSDGLVVRVGLAQPALSSLATTRRGELAAATGLTLAAILLLTWWLGGRFILRPTASILETVRALEAGEMGARVPLGGTRRMELARIAAAFNHLADSLAARQQALAAELGRSHDALALLDQVLNSMQEALLAVGPDGGLLLSNRAASQLLPLEAQVPGTAWFASLGFHGPDGETPLAAEETPLALAATAGTGEALVHIRNDRVPEGRLVQCGWQPIRGSGGIVGGLVVFTDLTELRRLQVDQLDQLQALREARRKLEEAQRIGRMGHWEQELATGRLWWSDEVFVLFGIDPSGFDFSMASFLSRVHPEDRSLVKARRREELHQGRMLQVEYRVLRPDGRVAWMHEIAKPRLDAAGEPVWLSGVVQDITERKLQEQALRAGEQAMQGFSLMLQRAAEAAPVITAQPTVEGVVQALCEQVRRVLGADEARVSLDTAPVPAAAGAVLAVPLSGADGRVIGSLRVARKQGAGFDGRDQSVATELAQLATVAIRNAQLLAQVRELNSGLEQRIADRTAALVRQERQFRALAEQAPEVVWNTDRDGLLTFLNHAWYDLVGGNPQDALGTGWLRRLHPEDRPAVVANWERSRVSRAPYSGTRRFLGRDGRWHTMSYRAVPILDEAGEVASWVGIDADVSGLKAIEDALRASNEELESFSYAVSHDLRAPLAAIAGFSQALRERLGGQADDRSLHYLSRIMAGVHKMERQIEAMLSLSRVTQAPLEWDVVDLSAIAEETLEALRVSEPQRQVAAEVQPGLSARGDPRLLRVVLENLLGNAWKFTAGKPRARIAFGQEADTRAWFVRDNGVGFDMAYAGKLFNAFHRLHGEGEFPGTGVGLATVRRIVSRHQGRVWAESAVGLGTTLRFTLSDVRPGWGGDGGA